MALTNCPECNQQVSDQATTCPNCGYPLSQTGQQTEPQIQAKPAPVKKKKGKGCLISATVFLVITVVLGIAMVNGVKTSTTSTSSSSAVEATPEQLLAFDDRSWADFKNLYNAHNYLINAVTTYSNGRASAVDLYDYCSKAEDYFRGVSLSFDYGTTSDEKAYLQPFASMALADQSAAANLKKYLDSKKTSDLSNIQSDIQRANEAVSIIAENRGELLVKAGLTDEEIKAKVDADMKDLERLR